MLVVTIGLLSASGAAGQVRVALPLGGYYRPGQYMPVELVIGERTGPVEIGTMLPSAITPPANARVIAAVLMLDAGERELSWRSEVAVEGSQRLALQALREDQRLVGLATADGEGLGEAVFPDHDVVTVRLAAAQALAGWPGAWDALDAVVVDEPPREAARLRAAGVRVVVRGDGAERVDGLRVLGPVSARFDERVYLPTQAWRPAPRREMRQLVLLMGVAFALVAMAVALWRGRLQLVVMAALVGATAVGIEIYRRSQPAVSQRLMVVVQDLPDDALVDVWRWHKVLRSSRGESALEGLTYPIFASAAHLRSVSPRLRCASDGRPEALEWSLAAESSIALLSREPAEAVPDEGSELSALMLEMARIVYGERGSEVRAEGGRVVVTTR